MLQISQGVEFISYQYRKKYWKIPQEGEFINRQYRQKYWKILRGEIYKPGSQANIFQFIWIDAGVSLQNTLSKIWTNSELDE